MVNVTAGRRNNKPNPNAPILQDNLVSSTKDGHPKVPGLGGEGSLSDKKK